MMINSGHKQDRLETNFSQDSGGSSPNAPPK